MPVQPQQPSAWAQALVNKGVPTTAPATGGVAKQTLPRLRSLAVASDWKTATSHDSASGVDTNAGDAVMSATGAGASASSDMAAGLLPHALGAHEISRGTGAQAVVMRAHGRRSDLLMRPGSWAKPLTMADAMAALVRDKYTATARRSTDARIRWWEKQSRVHKGRPLPLTVMKIRGRAKARRIQISITISVFHQTLSHSRRLQVVTAYVVGTTRVHP